MQNGADCSSCGTRRPLHLYVHMYACGLAAHTNTMGSAASDHHYHLGAAAYDHMASTYYSLAAYDYIHSG